MATSRKDIETIPDPSKPTAIEADKPTVEKQLIEQQEQLPPGRTVPEQIPPMHHESLTERLQHAAQSLQESAKGAFVRTEEAIVGGAREVGHALQESIEAAESKFKSAASLAGEKTAEAKHAAGSKLSEGKQAVESKAGETKDAVKQESAEMKAAVTQKAEGARQAALNLASDTKAMAKSAAGDVKDKAESLKQAAEQKAGDIKESLESKAISAKYATAEQAERAGKQLSKSKDAVKGALSSLASGAEREAAESLETSQRAIDEELAEAVSVPSAEAEVADPRKRTEADKLLGVSR